MLSRVYIDNYRCFVNFTFKPAREQLVLGANGAGKTAFLDALRAVRDFAVMGEKVQRFFDEETKTRWRRLTQQSFELEVIGNGGTYLYTLWVEVQDHKSGSRVLKETLDFEEKPLPQFVDDQVRLYDDRHQKTAEYPFDSDRSALSVLGRRRTSSKLEWFKNWLSGLLCLRVDPAQMGAEAREDDDYLDDHLRNFAAWYSHVIQEETGSLIRLQGALKDVLDGFDSLDLKRVGRTSRVLQANFALSDKSSPPASQLVRFDFDELSDGQKVLVALYVLLNSAIERDTTICIDEPDNFLALAEIQPWLFALSDRVQELGAQAILISHHPELIDLLAPEQGVIFSRDGVGPVRVDKYRPDSLGKLRPSELIARGWERG